MKRILLAASLISFSSAGVALAEGGGKPAAHGLSGSDWGSAVSSAAKEGGLGGHASGGKGGGAPAAHGLSGSDWGSAVSSAAKEGGLGGHASGKD
jgi:hypothetical protein